MGPQNDKLTENENEPSSLARHCILKIDYEQTTDNNTNTNNNYAIMEVRRYLPQDMLCILTAKYASVAFHATSAWNASIR